MTVHSPSYVMQTTWGALAWRGSQDSSIRTRSEGPGLRRTWGRERKAGEGRVGGRTVSAAAAEG
eukprot:6549431-Pyramimonas_sp.AAC.1